MEFRLMAKADFEGVVDLMVRVFFHSTLYTWAARDEKERLKILNAMFRFRVAGWLESSLETELALEEGRIVASATWHPPQNESAKPGNARRSMDEVFAGLAPEVVERWSQFRPVIEAQEKNIIQPAWELAPIAVLPEKQGKKIGSALITRKLAALDAAGLPCYLCTQDRINLAIYGRFGFRKIEEILIAPGGPVSYTMVREAPAPVLCKG
ncbi:MAG: GNAT family N-acetyltransferase [Treponema sp.]|jgi:GNAT superfamily N-acetyltransferase|nr:GNAT family N-acetyltransferase [Treponema sp.]